MKLVLNLMIVLFLITICRVEAKEFNSGDKKVQFIELFTSQGCSSCPPADKWLNSFKKSDKLWTHFVPVEFHVSYWNYLSWKDKFSKEEYSKRQKTYNSKIHAGVYTPQVLLNGKDFRLWRHVSNNDLISDEKVGNLKVSLNSKLNHAAITFSSIESDHDLICFGAYIQGNKNTIVTSGENSGSKMQNEFVVIDFQQTEMKKNNQKYACNLLFTSKEVKRQQSESMAFWVSNKKTFEVIQATGGYIQ